ncbi:hypothetical protein SAMN02746066_03245 [Anaerosporobacter mobilis DSM 15930]|uniref:Uncharacterized protein n=1 Tax=Anaerosporobacter mobilis DSM 15930 TaxID=1120996 RepID=A0A1M7LG66_9FIRM|nr:hypothetical protein [Anaerosporobacter mobilis]SHM77039.1 hypothetical protein SAMN02746066_03245 [Anaerosporobacter mobilis DSM 15930]
MLEKYMNKIEDKLNNTLVLEDKRKKIINCVALLEDERKLDIIHKFIARIL